MEEAVRNVLGQVNKQLTDCKMFQEDHRAVELIVQSPYVVIIIPVSVPSHLHSILIGE